MLQCQKIEHTYESLVLVNRTTLTIEGIRRSVWPLFSDLMPHHKLSHYTMTR